VSYYTIEDVNTGKLRTPAYDERVMALELPADVFALDNLRAPPKTVRNSQGRVVIE
jgi:hypothetical protein